MIIEKLVQYVDVILLFVFKTSTFDSINSQYLEIFVFIRIDVMCFTEVVFLKIYSVFPEQKCVFFFADKSQKKIMTDTTIYNKR